jgi:hypothetical protein
MTKFLKKLSEAPLPVWVYQTEPIGQVRTCVSAGLVTVRLPSDLRSQSPTTTPAKVLKITAEGKRALKKYLERLGWC